MTIDVNSVTSHKAYWTFIYPVAEVLAGAKEKKKYHETRKIWWGDKKTETITKIKSEGITITESIVEELSKLGYSTQRNGGPQVTIDNKMQQDLSECVSKIKEHELRIKEYDAWVQILTAKAALNVPNDTLTLTQTDWLYFFGK